MLGKTGRAPYVSIMRKRELTLPELMFIIATRAAIAGGVALLLSDRLNSKQRKALGAVLIGFGAVTTVPAAMIVFGTRDEPPDKIEAA